MFDKEKTLRELNIAIWDDSKKTFAELLDKAFTDIANPEEFNTFYNGIYQTYGSKRGTVRETNLLFTAIEAKANRVLTYILSNEKFNFDASKCIDSKNAAQFAYSQLEMCNEFTPETFDLSKDCSHINVITCLLNFQAFQFQQLQVAERQKCLRLSILYHLFIHGEVLSIKSQTEHNSRWLDSGGFFRNHLRSDSHPKSADEIYGQKWLSLLRDSNQTTLDKAVETILDDMTYRSIWSSIGFVDSDLEFNSIKVIMAKYLLEMYSGNIKVTHLQSIEDDKGSTWITFDSLKAVADIWRRDIFDKVFSLSAKSECCSIELSNQPINL